MGRGYGPITGADLDSGAPPMSAMPDPRMDITPTPEQTPGAPERPIKQPGYRRSIKEYLEEIKMMQAQGQGVVPTFTNIQGGGMDVSQGQLDGQDVRSYVNPEYIEGATGGMTRGPAHPVSQAQQATYGQAGGEGDGPLGTHWTSDAWPNERALRDSDEVIAALDQQLGRNATPEEQIQALNQYRVSLYSKQADMWADAKKKYKDASTGELLAAYKTGDFTRVQKAGEDAFSEESIKERSVDLGEEYLAYVKKEQEVPINDETGEPFTTADEYIKYHLNEYQEMIDGILQAAAEQSQVAQPGAGKEPAGDLNAILSKLTPKTGNDGKQYVTHQGKTYLVGE